MAKICVVEDDPILLEFISFNLSQEGYAVLLFSTGTEAIQNLEAIQNCDLIMLDQMLPGYSGIELCSEIRKKSQVPILFLSAKGDTADRINGLKAGANDYLSKPFNLEELLLRIQVLLPKKSHLYAIGNFIVDFDSMQVNHRETHQSFAFTKKEMALLTLFIQNENRVLSRDEILDKVWGEDVYPTSRTIDNFVLTFRRIFEPDPKDPDFFHSIRGVGYKFCNSRK